MKAPNVLPRRVSDVCVVMVVFQLVSVLSLVLRFSLVVRVRVLTFVGEMLCTVVGRPATLVAVYGAIYCFLFSQRKRLILQVCE